MFDQHPHPSERVSSKDVGDYANFLLEFLDDPESPKYVERAVHDIVAHPEDGRPPDYVLQLSELRDIEYSYVWELLDDEEKVERLAKRYQRLKHVAACLGAGAISYMIVRFDLATNSVEGIQDIWRSVRG